MTVIRPTMPECEFSDPILAFRDFQMASSWSVRIDPDPLGVVNRIVRLMNGDTQVRAALAHLPVGATVRLVRDGYSGFGWRALGGPGWRALSGLGPDPEPEPFHLPGWRVEVDGETVLSATDAELRPPYVPPPPPPIWRRARNALRERTRAIADRIAAHLGYHRDGECEEGW